MEGRRGEGRKEGRKELESHTTAQLGFLIPLNPQAGRCYYTNHSNYLQLSGWEVELLL
jgi:hypothetical protein